jgi:16S rRNA (uracil1498-N3)-methyltransferase
MAHARKSRPPLLYAPDIAGRSADEVLNLPGEEGSHVRALRLETGAVVRLTDGRGSMWSARLHRPDGRTISCALEAPITAPPRLPVEVAFAVANRAHTLWLVEKATEFGVAVLSPIEFSRSRSVSDAGRSPGFWSKAERRAVSAMKQSGGAWLPELRPPVSVRDYVTRLEEHGPGGGHDGPRIRVLLDTDGKPLRAVLASWDGAAMAVLMVGPEGGLLEEERIMVLGSGFEAGRLSRLVLRFETAATSAVAVAAQQMESIWPAVPASSAAPAGAGDQR